MDTPSLHINQEWPYVLTLLPADLEETARETNALIRCRNVPSAASLMRTILAYALSDLSLKDVAAWASALGVAQITGPGLFYRLREAETWLGRVLAQTLGEEVRNVPRGLRLRAVDATVINGPGATGTDWRAHLRIDPVTGSFQSVELTDSRGPEGYERHAVQAGEVILGDRAYATARGIYAVQRAQADVVVRLNPHAIRICDENKKRVSLLEELEKVPKLGAIDYSFLVPIPPERATRSHKPWSLAKAIDWVPSRVVAARTRKGEVIWVLTTLPYEEVSSVRVLELYRVRWQIELLFKRLKSLLHLDTLPSRQGPTAKSWMLARFLAAALVQKLIRPSGPLSPWGYELRENGIRA